MRRRERVRFHQQRHDHRREPAEHRVRDVVRERDAREAHDGRKALHQHERHRADRADGEAREPVERHEARRVDGDLRVHRVVARGERDAADRQHRLRAEAVGERAGGDAAGREAQRRDAVREQRGRGRDVELLLQQRRRHQDHDDDRRRQHPRDQHRYDHRTAVVADHGLQRDFGRERLARLHFGEHGRLVQPAAQVDGEQAEHAAEQERDAPRERGNLGRREAAVDGRRDERAEQDADGQARRQRAARIADALRRHVLGDEHPRARHFAAHRRALQHAQQQQHDGREDADAVVGGQQAHQERRHRHQQHAQREHPLAADEVAEVRHHDAAERPREIAGREDAERLQLAQPVGNVVRKEQLADRGREEHEDDEIVELQRAAQCGEAERLVVAARQGAGRGARDGAQFGSGHGQGDLGSNGCVPREKTGPGGGPRCRTDGATRGVAHGTRTARRPDGSRAEDERDAMPAILQD
ncbi:hypothetical protein DP42_5160 [Burkholderia pseudomallei]|nr:hypothetical protein DP42_5160 [Burkholderia pseudomallei]